METRDIRRMMLRKIIVERFNGKASRLAEAVGRTQPTIAMMLQGTRVFGENIARDIEKRLGLPPLYLDGISEAELRFARLICQLPEERQTDLMHYLEAEVAILRHKSIVEERKPMLSVVKTPSSQQSE